MEHIRATPQTFANYGKVVDYPTIAPTAQGANYKYWADLAHYLIEGESEIGICTVYEAKDKVVESLERHLRTPEILIPIDASMLLPVLQQGEPDDEVKLFKVELGQAVVMDPGVWHAACFPYGKASCSYFVIFRRGTPEDDVEFKPLSPIGLGHDGSGGGQTTLGPTPREEA